MATTLFKRATTGKVQVWTIEIEGDKYRSISGEDGGKLTTNAWTTAKPKNVGRSNETTAAQQAQLEAEGKIKEKLKSGYGPDKDNVDAYAVAISPMLAESWADYKDKAVSQALASQPKLDGIRSVGTDDGLFSREGNQFVSCPHIEEEVRLVLRNLPPGAKLDGELYNHLFKDDFNAIVKLIKRQKCTLEDLEKTREFAEYHIYDVDMPDVPFQTRCIVLATISQMNLQYIKVVPTHFYPTHLNTTALEAAVNETYQQWLLQGYEGQMIRVANSLYQHKRTPDLLKRKEQITEEFEIVEIEEGEGNRSGMAGAVVCKMPSGKTFGAGIKGNAAYYTELLQMAAGHIGKKATIRYHKLTPDGKPRHGVMIAIRDYE